MKDAEKKKLKAERAVALAASDRLKRLATAGVDADPRTAQGKREFDVVGLGHSLRASINHLNNCFKNRIDRTDSRVLTWAKIDDLQRRVHKDDIRAPGFEPGVDTSTVPEVPLSKLKALSEDARLHRHLGTDMHCLLRGIIYHQMSYVQAAGLNASFWEHKQTAVKFKRALDQAAAFYGVAPETVHGSRTQDALRRREKA